MKRIIKKGFTLIELIVVVSIISILLLIIIVNYRNSLSAANIRAFEANARFLMWEINTCYSDDNGKIDNIFDKVNPKAVELNGRPKFATYSIDKSTKILICRLDKKSFSGSEDYIIKYEPTTQKITQEPYGNNGEKLIKNAINFTN